MLEKTMGISDDKCTLLLMADARVCVRVGLLLATPPRKRGGLFSECSNFAEDCDASVLNVLFIVDRIAVCPVALVAVGTCAVRFASRDRFMCCTGGELGSVLVISVKPPRDFCC
jgi:hypothetical protein